MPQSLAKNLVHLVFSTKNRTPWLTDGIRRELYAYMAGILNQWKSPAIVIGGVADHVHILFSLSKNHALAKVIEEVKKGASKWLKQQSIEFRNFHWQAGYGAFFGESVLGRNRKSLHRESGTTPSSQIISR